MGRGSGRRWSSCTPARQESSGRAVSVLASSSSGRADLSDINAVPEAFDQRGLPVIQLARVIEYDVPDRAGNGTDELIVVLSTIAELAGNNTRSPILRCR